MKGGKDATKIVLTALIPIVSNQNGFAGCDHDKRISLPEMRRIQFYNRFQDDNKRIRQKTAQMPEMRLQVDDIRSTSRISKKTKGGNKWMISNAQSADADAFNTAHRLNGFTKLTTKNMPANGFA